MSQPTPDETLLGLLTHQPQHGYQLLETFEDVQALGRVWKLSTSQLYAVLKRLQNQGFITGEEAYSIDAPPRTVYHITSNGEAYVKAWLWENHPSPSVRRVRVEFLSRLYIARLLNFSQADIIRHQKVSCLAKRDALLAQQDFTDDSIGSQALALEITQFESILAWIAHLEHIAI
ncbi:MAG: PadR family transcriptional regulator [Chloroflexi bacterium]|nr:PadR family transcriptional regulator [Chloroflexota bacterium]MCC6892433.1 PadR family transcriptional regulator [Anaerolineae bacterium]